MLYYVVCHVLYLRVSHVVFEILVSLETWREVHGRNVELNLFAWPIQVYIIREEPQCLNVTSHEIASNSLEILDHILLEFAYHFRRVDKEDDVFTFKFENVLKLFLALHSISLHN